MKILLMLLLSVPMFAQQKNNVNNLPEKMEQTSTPTAPPPMASGEKSYMMIDAHNRAIDYKEAYEILRKEKTANRIQFQLANGEIITNILEIMLTTNGSLIIFKSTTPQGLKYNVVPVESIVSLSHQ